MTFEQLKFISLVGANMLIFEDDGKTLRRIRMNDRCV